PPIQHHHLSQQSRRGPHLVLHRVEFSVLSRWRNCGMASAIEGCSSALAIASSAVCQARADLLIYGINGYPYRGNRVDSSSRHHYELGHESTAAAKAFFAPSRTPRAGACWNS